MRINKFLSKAGLGSRRKVEELVISGRVKINGNKVKKLSTRISLSDTVCYDEKVVNIKFDKKYFILNKPIGYISTVKDSHAKKTVMDLIEENKGLFPVGRLDKNSRGLMIITNDGDFALKITHPRYSCEKEYVVTVAVPRERKSEKIEQVMRFFKCGIKLEKCKTLPARIKLISIEKDKARFNIVLNEGKKRQIRRIFKKARMDVVDLMRIRIGDYKIGNLESGEIRSFKYP